MNKTKQKYLKRALAAAFIVACAALFYSIVFEKYSVSYYENQIKNVENQIQKQQNELEKISIKLLNIFCTTPDSLLTDALFDVDIDGNASEGVFCFYNDSLIYWSSSLP
ncbi:MAG: hypothetical protein LBT56_08530, partial [Prevotellaceae bacterium]|nr:hypothetical protein [Prevotellaceae bacterium]